MKLLAEVTPPRIIKMGERLSLSLCLYLFVFSQVTHSNITCIIKKSIHSKLLFSESRGENVKNKNTCIGKQKCVLADIPEGGNLNWGCCLYSCRLL